MAFLGTSNYIYTNNLNASRPDIISDYNPAPVPNFSISVALRDYKNNKNSLPVDVGRRTNNVLVATPAQISQLSSTVQTINTPKPPPGLDPNLVVFQYPYGYQSSANANKELDAIREVPLPPPKPVSVYSTSGSTGQPEPYPTKSTYNRINTYVRRFNGYIFDTWDGIVPEQFQCMETDNLIYNLITILLILCIFILCKQYKKISSNVFYGCIGFIIILYFFLK